MPSCGFSLAVSGMTRPDAVVVSASLACTRILSSSGLMFTFATIGALHYLDQSPGRSPGPELAVGPGRAPEPSELPGDSAFVRALAPSSRVPTQGLADCHLALYT
ncbi:Uncharacterised protein [Mycobacterium tuberculosis]|uniref:Uncharacterized protein n=1 Tax=Mycobacterium tuberculosis TaxID=1773 RepID=A0A654U7B9_MYCTX|nr:Uncharacterised protein [Mycobacterium tuberculosis]